MIKSKIIKKRKMGSNGMEPNRLILNSNCNCTKYLNVSIPVFNRYAGMAEWLTQLIDTQRPSGHVGSIPTSSVTNIKLLNEKL
jgi:hypothetical protein